MKIIREGNKIRIIIKHAEQKRQEKKLKELYERIAKEKTGSRCRTKKKVKGEN